MITTNIDNILAAVGRAEASGFTDEQQAQLKLAKTLSTKILDACDEAVKQGLETGLVLKTFAGMLGLAIRSNRRAGPSSGLAVALILCDMILQEATKP